MKRILDIVFSAIGLIVLLPLMLIVAIAVKLSSSGPILYRGVRSGFKGKPFKILKFRTMVTMAEQKGGPSTALNDPRLTRIGKFLRRYKIDELPQFINILCGEMSFVGPRPQVLLYTSRYTPEELRILDVRPGLTDYASIELINLDEILGDEDVDEKYILEIEPKKNKLRLKYVDEQSLRIDAKILFMTFKAMIKN